MKHLFSSVLLSSLTVLVHAGAFKNENFLPARPTHAGEGFEIIEGTSPATTPAPKVRFRNAKLVPRLPPGTCGFLSNPAATVPQPYNCVDATCMTSGSYFGCSSEPYTACYDGTARICQTGRLGSLTRCCTQTTNGWRPWCVDYKMTDSRGTKTLVGCYNTLLSRLNTNSIFLVSDTSLISRVSPSYFSSSRTSTSTSTTPFPTTSSDLWTGRVTLVGPASDPTLALSVTSIPSESDSPSSASSTDSPAPSSAPVDAIVGGVVGGVAVIGLGVFAIVWFLLRRKKTARTEGPFPPQNQPETTRPFVTSPSKYQRQQPQYEPQQQQQSPGPGSKINHQQPDTPTSPLPTYHQTAFVTGGGGPHPTTYEVPAVNVRGTDNNMAEMSG